jgi:methionine-rich copper-binding protein CopC
MTKLPPCIRLVAACALAGALTLPLAGVASAHASLVHANIKPSQVFAHNAYPRTLTAFFAEHVNPKGSWVHVFEGDPKGDHGMVDLGNVQFPFKNPKEITVGLPRGFKGFYTLMWFTQSADDGHWAGNAFTFSVK